MLKLLKISSLILVSTVFLAPVLSQAEEMDAAPKQAPHAVKQKSYGAQVGEKALNGVTNVGTAILELPKGIINTTQETNIIYGLIGGTGAGIFNTLGRLSTGLIDLVSAPVPSDPLVNPVRVWEKFDKRTTYGIQYHLEEPTNQMPTY